MSREHFRIDDEHTQLEALVKELRAELDANRREFEEFADVISHDLKAPLRAIRSLVDWLVSDYKDKFDDEGKKRLSLMVRRVQRMHGLVEGIVQYSGARKTNDVRLDVDLRRVAEAAIEMVAIPENVSVVIETALPRVACDPVRIQQVFENLVYNAVQASDKPHGLVRIGATEKPPPNCHVLYVADNGPGLSEASCKRLSSGNAANALPGGLLGVGLGLAIVIKNIQKSGGELRVESKLGEGSTFFFTLRKDGGAAPCPPLP